MFPFAGRKNQAGDPLSVTDALRASSNRSIMAATQTETRKMLRGAIAREHRSTLVYTDFIL